MKYVEILKCICLRSFASGHVNCRVRLGRLPKKPSLNDFCRVCGCNFRVCYGNFKRRVIFARNQTGPGWRNAALWIKLGFHPHPHPEYARNVRNISAHN